MDGRTYVVLNPVAGHSDPQLARRALERHFDEAGRPYELYETTGRERLWEVVQGALNRGFDRLVAVGGDGTVSGVADGLVGTGVPLGIVPMGTGNALARDLGIPLDLDGALRLLQESPATRQVDAMEVGGHYYFLHVGVGLSALTMRDTEQDSKRRFGRLAYIWAGLVQVTGVRLRRFAVTVDGRRHPMRASEVMVLNCGALGAPYLRLYQHVDLDDGRVDVYVLRGRTLLDYIRVAGRSLLGRERRDPSVRYLPAEGEVEIRAGRPLPVQADGDIVGEAPVRIAVVPRAVGVIVPEEDAEIAELSQ